MKHQKEIETLKINTCNGVPLDNNDILYIDTFYCGLEKVEQRYLVDDTPSANNSNEVIESSYNSRLVSKINILFEIPQKNPYNLDCAGPEKKGIYTYKGESQMIIKHPDIVIHKGNTPLEGIQELVCEIKRKTMLGPCEMIYDLHKLISYSSQETYGNPYKIAVFVVTNISKKQLIEKVRNFRDEEYIIEKLLPNDMENRMSFSQYITQNQERLKNILCFCHVEEGNVELSSVYDVVQSKIRK